MTEQRKFITVRHVQEITALSRSASYELMDRLGAVKLGRATRLSKQKLDSYLRQLEVGASWKSTAAFSEPNVESGTSKPTTGKTANENAHEEAPVCETTEQPSQSERPKLSAVTSSNRLRLAKVALLAQRRSRKR